LLCRHNAAGAARFADYLLESTSSSMIHDPMIPTAGMSQHHNLFIDTSVSPLGSPNGSHFLLTPGRSPGLLHHHHGHDQSNVLGLPMSVLSSQIPPGAPSVPPSPSTSPGPLPKTMKEWIAQNQPKKPAQVYHQWVRDNKQRLIAQGAIFIHNTARVACSVEPPKKKKTKEGFFKGATKINYGRDLATFNAEQKLIADAWKDVSADEKHQRQERYARDIVGYKVAMQEYEASNLLFAILD
jgi:hypothetical protein